MVGVGVLIGGEYPAPETQRWIPLFIGQGASDQASVGPETCGRGGNVLSHRREKAGWGCGGAL